MIEVRSKDHRSGSAVVNISNYVVARSFLFSNINFEFNIERSRCIAEICFRGFFLHVNNRNSYDVGFIFRIEFELILLGRSIIQY